ncbi:hypothetical protein [Streptomyces cyaneofuscatus]|uniref:hypothetical protein n=1 Tax=Streptomyces cyaneofuscatus TaxID=66883 RepID=UPI002F913D0A|nr:hypothetical protein OG973_36765 [Streptomyces cyaneofuscatus]
MLAIPERVSGRGDTPDQTIWHKPIGRVVEEFQAIACGEEEGVTMPRSASRILPVCWTHVS